MAVLREGSWGPLCPQGAIPTRHREQNAAHRRNASPALWGWGNAPRIQPPTLTPAPKPKPAAGRGEGITTAETSEQHWVWSNSSKEKTAAGFEIPGWCLVGSRARVGSYPNLWCPNYKKKVASGKLVGMASAEGVP